MAQAYSVSSFKHTGQFSCYNIAANVFLSVSVPDLLSSHVHVCIGIVLVYVIDITGTVYIMMQM